MSRFLGEFECKIDAKGRIIIPAGLRKQIPQEAEERLVVNRGFERCLNLYPKNEWDLISAEVDKLSDYIEKERRFKYYFNRGATELTVDSASRILLPKKLLEYGNIKTEVVLFAHGNKIEIWNKDAYESLITNEPEDFSMLAEEVMGNRRKEGDDQIS